MDDLRDEVASYRPIQVAVSADLDGAYNLPLPPEGLNMRRFMEEIEVGLINQALRRTGGNRSAAADLLGINRTTLVDKLRRRDQQASDQGAEDAAGAQSPGNGST